MACIASSSRGKTGMAKVFGIVDLPKGGWEDRQRSLPCRNSCEEKRALATGMNQTNAMEHAKALVSNGGMKVAVVAVVHVPRNCDTELYQSLEVKRGKSKTKQETGPRWKR